MSKQIVLFSVIYCVILNVIFCARLNTPRVLLPPNYGNTKNNFTLIVSDSEGGCYKWSSSRTDIVTVTPINEACSSKAVVSSVFGANPPQIAIITAEDHANNIILRCDVVVDSVKLLEFVTTSRQLFLGDAPTLIEVMGRNDQGDTFSTLNGIEFEWTLETKGDQNTLRFLKFADSTYQPPEFINYLEEKGLQGHLILIESFKTGTSKVRVRLRDPAFMDVQPADIILIVAANVVLNPAYDIRVLKNSQIQYKIDLIKDGRATEIPLPSDEYYLEISDQEIAKIDVDTSIVTAKQLGHTTIILKDKNAKATETKQQISAGIHVVEPSYMLFHVTPGENWALQELSFYEVSLKLYDDRHHRIIPSDNLRIDVQFHTKYFKVNYQSPNCTYFLVKTLLPGPTKIWAELKGLEVDGSVIKASTPTKVTQEVIIYQFLQVQPNVVLMPYNEVEKTTYSLTIRAKGATGIYHWDSENPSLASVSYKPEEDSKVAVVKTSGQGDVVIHVKDAYNSVFRSSASISIQPVADLEILPTIVEAEIGSEVIIPLALYGYEDAEKKKRKIFNSCSDIPITVEVVEKTRIQYVPDAQFPAVGDGCRSLAFKCVSVGYSRIFVQYDSGNLHLKTTAVVACHKPLKPVFPARMMLLPLGGTAEVVFEGGPRPWPLFKEGHIIHLQELETSLSSNYIIRDPIRYNKDLHVFKVICNALGETTMEISVGNKKSATNPNPAILRSELLLGCGVPETIFLKPMVKGPDGKKVACPVGEDAALVPIQNYDKFDIDIWAKDFKGRKFSNLTSLEIIWELSDYTYGKLDMYKDVIVNFNGANGFKRINRNYRVFHPSGKEGQVKITARVVGFRSDIMKKAGIELPELFKEPIVKSLTLELVSDATIDPSKATVFNHPTNKVALNISKGSGYFTIEVSDETKVEVEHLQETRQILVTPKEEGSVTITVHDLCLETQQIAVADIQVSGVEKVIVKMVDKVELNKTIIALVQVMGYDGQPLAANLYPLLNLTPESSSIISTKLHKVLQPNDLQALYTITGAALGQTTLSFKIQPDENLIATKVEVYKGRPISSDNLPIQVFSPLQLSPRNITLVVGASFEVICSGGPELHSSIHYSVQDDSIATVSTSGILTASKLGKTTLTAQSIDVEKVSGKQVVYSQDQATIYVVPLHGIKIHAPLRRLQTETRMPLYAMGLNSEETPFAFGSALPKLSFRWGLNNTEVVHFENMYKQSNNYQSGGNNFATRVVALQPGQVTVTLEVWTSSTSDSSKVQLSGMLFRDELPLQVFGDLQLIKPRIKDDAILITQNTNLHLKSSRDSFARLSYNVVPINSNPVVKIESGNRLISGPQTGDETLKMTAMDDYGIQQMKTVDVKVRNLAYLMLMAESPPWMKGAISFLPYGWTTSFSVSFHDNIGMKFHSANVQLKFRQSRFDKIHVNEGVNNKSLVIRACEPGQTVLKVWDASNPQVVDFISVVVKPAIDPFNANLVEGDVLCFNSPLISKEGEPGLWGSENNNVDIHPSSGVAFAAQPGSAVIHYSISETQVTKSEVNVLPVTSLVIDTTIQNFVTNSLKTLFHIPVLLEGAGDLVRNLIGRNCSITDVSHVPNIHPPFSCRLSFDSKHLDLIVEDIFQSVPSFDFKLGEYSCQIKSFNKMSSERISVLDTNLILKVEHRNGFVSGSSPLDFYPEFFVETTKLSLSSIKTVSNIIVKATAKVAKFLELKPADPSILHIGLPTHQEGHPSTLLFPVTLKKCPHIKDALSQNIMLRNDATNQEVLVRVETCLDEDGREFRPPWADYVKNFTILLGTLIALYIGFKVLLAPRFVDVRSQSTLLPPVTPVTTQVRPHLWTVDNSFPGVTTPSPHRPVNFPPSPGRPNYSYSEYLQPPRS